MTNTKVLRSAAGGMSRVSAPLEAGAGHHRVLHREGQQQGRVDPERRPGRIRCRCVDAGGRAPTGEESDRPEGADDEGGVGDHGVPEDGQTGHRAGCGSHALHRRHGGRRGQAGKYLSSRRRSPRTRRRSAPATGSSIRYRIRSTWASADRSAMPRRSADLPVRAPLSDQRRHLALPGRQRRGGTAATSRAGPGTGGSRDVSGSSVTDVRQVRPARDRPSNCAPGMPSASRRPWPIGAARSAVPMHHRASARLIRGRSR